MLYKKKGIQGVRILQGNQHIENHSKTYNKNVIWTHNATKNIPDRWTAGLLQTKITCMPYLWQGKYKKNK